MLKPFLFPFLSGNHAMIMIDYIRFCNGCSSIQCYYITGLNRENHSYTIIFSVRHLWQFRVVTPNSKHTFSLNFGIKQSIFLVIISPDQFMHIFIILTQYLIMSFIGLNDRQ